MPTLREDRLSRDIDALISSTLKHLRERWWNAEFTEFLRETLQPQAGDRILDVGCGVGTAEVTLGQLGISQLKLFGLDLISTRVREAVEASRKHNVRAGFVAADARMLPFVDGAFDSTFCVAVLQHVRDVSGAVQEFARVTKPGGRVLVVEPDNAARYWYSSTSAGADAFEFATRFFRAIETLGDGTDLAVGPRISEVFTQHGIEATAIRLFLVSRVRLGAPPPAVWHARLEIVEGAIDRVQDESLRRMGADYLRVLDRYEKEATAAGPRLVEIQSTTLFATVGKKIAAEPA
jgi:ubiquinone/menaquinone biosynthesis C-methylase UbiE